MSKRKKEHLCFKCGRAYELYKSFRSHLLKKHPDKVDDISSSKNSRKIYNFKCKSCDKQFNHFRNLRYHERKFHSSENVIKDSFKCSVCEFRPNTKTSSLNHLKSKHAVTVEPQEIEFSSFEDFLTWKENVEKETHSRYVKESGSKRCADNSMRHYFVCHRSGYYISKSIGKRHLKIQGSNKINGACPASIRVIEHEGGVCKISYVATHVGHKNDIDHLNLSDSERSDLAKDIANNIPFPAILDKIHRVSVPKLDRVHLLTRKDLYNIKQCYNLQTSARDSDNVTESENAHDGAASSDSNLPIHLESKLGVAEKEFCGKKSCSASVNISDEKSKLKEDILGMLNGISTTGEVEVIKRYTAFMKAALTSVCLQDTCPSNDLQAL